MFESFGWKAALDIFQMLALGLLWLYTRYQRQQSATSDEIKALTASVSEQAHAMTELAASMTTRVHVLETRVNALPTHNELAAIYEKLNDLRVGVGKLEGLVPGIDRMLGLIHDHLLNQKRDKELRPL
jgi:hypothetical protein